MVSLHNMFNITKATQNEITRRLECMFFNIYLCTILFLQPT